MKHNAMILLYNTINNVCACLYVYCNLCIGSVAKLGNIFTYFDYSEF